MFSVLVDGVNMIEMKLVVFFLVIEKRSHEIRIVRGFASMGDSSKSKYDLKLCRAYIVPKGPRALFT